jgi:hypothetical protein
MPGTMPAVVPEADCAVAHTGSLADARRLALRMLDCARPLHESLLGYAMACSEWRLRGFHACTGPVFDEVNALRAIWWYDGLASPAGAGAAAALAAVLQDTASAG